MRIVLEFDDNQILVVVGSERHHVLEAHFRYDGPLPVMDLTHPLGELEPIGPQAHELGPRTMDSVG